MTRRLLLFLLLALPLAAPATARPDPAAPVRAFLAAMTAKDRSAVAALIDDAAVFQYPFDRSGKTEAGSWRRFTGRDAVLTGYVDGAFAKIARIGWTEADFTPSADGRTVFVEARGDMLLATGAVYRNRYVLRFDLHRGRIRGMKEYMNPVTAALAAGLPLGKP
ncbi:ketosteroid isomerase-like protein [Sphingomonas kaistensis]|uniref:Ketosteroid isomerase-like protein n=1 Tax=Sphingomonas kaistensis TaxID=298708 RepID=A0A7X5Y306_9SPHN|nr:nuclear transport factor 2 family protein [Sphingomonas kaistensis]NJC04246.1 ketosteroid isomerase-like protein [Sphingomonas kaistensis]